MKSKSASKVIEQMLGESFSFSTILIGLRTREDMTQQELADKLGVSKAYICDLEKKRRFVSVDRARDFARTLKEREERWVETALQDMVDRAGIKARVKLVA